MVQSDGRHSETDNRNGGHRGLVRFVRSRSDRLQVQLQLPSRPPLTHTAPLMTRRDEAIARLVADATRRIDQDDKTSLLASTVASSLERGLDKELHEALIQQGKEATETIGRICQESSEAFLESVGRVVTALGGPCEEVRESLEEVRNRNGAKRQ